MFHRSHAVRAVLAASAQYWRMHINARQQRPIHGQPPAARPAAGPCKQLRSTTAIKPRKG